MIQIKLQLSKNIEIIITYLDNHNLQPIKDYTIKFNPDGLYSKYKFDHNGKLVNSQIYNKDYNIEHINSFIEFHFNKKTQFHEKIINLLLL